MNSTKKFLALSDEEAKRKVQMVRDLIILDRVMDGVIWGLGIGLVALGVLLAILEVV